MALSIGDITDNVRKALKCDEEFQLQVQERLGLDLFYASDVFTCKVYRVWRRMKIQEENLKTEYERRAMDLGKKIHEKIQGYFEKYLGFLSEVRLISSHITGKADLYLEDEAIIEIKTTSCIPNYPIKRHVGQLQTYRMIYQKVMNKDIQCFLVYVNTDNDGLIDVRVFDVGNQWFKETIMDWKEVIELWNGFDERKIKEVFGKEECLKCGFRNVCSEINKRN